VTVRGGIRPYSASGPVGISGVPICAELAFDFVEQVADVDRQLRMPRPGIAAEDEAGVEGAVAVDAQLVLQIVVALARRSCSRC
jgi:hypothetical protein